MIRFQVHEKALLDFRNESRLLFGEKFSLQFPQRVAASSMRRRTCRVILPACTARSHQFQCDRFIK